MSFVQNLNELPFTASIYLVTRWCDQRYTVLNAVNCIQYCQVAIYSSARLIAIQISRGGSRASISRLSHLACDCNGFFHLLFRNIMLHHRLQENIDCHLLVASLLFSTTIYLRLNFLHGLWLWYLWSVVWCLILRMWTEQITFQSTAGEDLFPYVEHSSWYQVQSVREHDVELEVAWCVLSRLGPRFYFSGWEEWSSMSWPWVIINVFFFLLEYLKQVAHDMCWGSFSLRACLRSVWLLNLSLFEHGGRLMSSWISCHPFWTLLIFCFPHWDPMYCTTL